MERLTKQKKKHGRLPTTDNDSHGDLDKGSGREKYIQRQLLSIKVSCIPFSFQSRSHFPVLNCPDGNSTRN